MGKIATMPARLALLLLGVFAAMLWVLLSALDQSQARSLEIAAAHNDHRARFQERLISTRAQLDLLGRGIASDLDAQLTRMADQVQVIANTPYIAFRLGRRPGPADDGWRGLSLPMLKDAELYIANRDLDIIAHNGQTPSSELPIPYELLAPLDRGIRGMSTQTILELTDANGQKEAHFVFIKSIHDKEGVVGGVAFGTWPLSALKGWMSQWQRVQHDSLALALSWKGQFAAIAGPFDVQNPAPKLGSQRWEDEQYVYLNDIRPLEKWDLLLQVARSTQKLESTGAMEKSFSDIQYRALVASAVVLLTGLLLVWLAGRRYQNHLRHLTDRATDISMGALQTGLAGEAEIHDLRPLAQAIERMRRSLVVLMRRHPPKHPLD